MAKRKVPKLPPRDPMGPITQADIDRAYKNFYDFSACPVAVTPKPTRMFEVGEQVRLGGLEDVVVAEVLEGGKAYRLDYIRRERDNAERTTGCWWWYDVRKLEDGPAAESMFPPYLPGQVITSTIDSVMSLMNHGGLVCDPRYQRGYVWTEENQVNLIESLFSRLSIGTFIFSRHHGYLHEGDVGTTEYLNFDGERIIVPKRNDYTHAVIDGQQRLTTLWRFYTNQFKYKGLYFKQLAFRDQHEINSTSISYRIFDEDHVSYADVLRMFIGANMGVPQDPKHLEKVRNQLALETK